MIQIIVLIVCGQKWGRNNISNYFQLFLLFAQFETGCDTIIY